MRSCSSGWAAVIEAITTAGTPTTDYLERAGTADIADLRFESDSDPAQSFFATCRSRPTAHRRIHGGESRSRL